MTARFLLSASTLVLFSFTSFAQIVNVEGSRLDESKQGWQGLADLSFYAVKNTNTLYQLNNKLRLQYVASRHRWLMLNDINLSVSNELKFEQNAFQHLRYGLMLDSAYVLECFGQHQYDRIQLIKRRVLLGGGLRIRFLERGLINSYYGFTYMLEYEDELVTLNRNLHSRLSTYVNIKLTIKEWLKFLSTSYYQPRLSYFGDFRLSTNNTLEFKINGNLSILTKYVLIFDSSPVDDPSVPKINMKLTNGFSYKFK